MLLRSALVVAVGLTVSACSALGPAAPEPDPDRPAEPGTTYPAYETFDPSGYDADPAVAAEVEHDVPARVMEGRVVIPNQGGGAPPAPREPETVQVEGYRVQVFASPDRSAAERTRSEALAWWRQAGPSAGAEPEAVVAYQQPYYRVRIGAFASRDEADRALAAVRTRYPEAFLVPDLVTVTR